jgi:hypothetical protein
MGKPKTVISKTSVKKSPRKPVKKPNTKTVKRGVKLAMDCAWSEEGKSLKNKDVKPTKPKPSKHISEV